MKARARAKVKVKVKAKVTPHKRQHIETNNCCPFCGATHLQGSEVNIDGSYARQDCWCVTCDEQWTDVYKLHNIEV